MTRVEQRLVLKAFLHDFTPEMRNLLATDLDRFSQFDMSGLSG
jgi:hypothetical protein